MLPVRIFLIQPKAVLITVVSLTFAIFAGSFLYESYIRSSIAFNATDVGIQLASTASVSAHGGPGTNVAYAATVAPLPEMHIANNGLVLLRGAQVVSVSGDMIKVRMAWNSVYFTWAVQTGQSTQYFSSTGEKETSPAIQAGDVLTATGMLVQNGPQPTITAEFIDIE